MATMSLFLVFLILVCVTDFCVCKTSRPKSATVHTLSPCSETRMVHGNKELALYDSIFQVSDKMLKSS